MNSDLLSVELAKFRAAEQSVRESIRRIQELARSKSHLEIWGEDATHGGDAQRLLSEMRGAESATEQGLSRLGEMSAALGVFLSAQGLEAGTIVPPAVAVEWREAFAAFQRAELPLQAAMMKLANEMDRPPEVVAAVDAALEVCDRAREGERVAWQALVEYFGVLSADGG